MLEVRLDETTRSVGDLLRLFGHTGLRLASSEHGRDLRVRRTMLHDPYAEVEDSPGALLLGVGVRPTDVGAADVISMAASNGCSAVLVKEHGAPVDGLATVADQCGIALVVVHQDVEWLSLDALLNNALRASLPLGKSVVNAAVGDLFTLAGAVADTVGGATAIEDLTQRVLAYSSNAAQATDTERREGILGRKVPDLPDNEAQYRLLYRSPGAVRFPASDTGLGRLATAVRAGHELLGSIWVVIPQEGLAASAEEALAGAAPIAALHLLAARSSDDLVRQQRGDASRRLLEGAGNAADAADVLGLDLGGPFAVLAFAPVHLDDARAPTAERLLSMVTLYCETRLGRTGSVLLDGTLFVVATGPQVGSEPMLEALADDVVTTAASSLQMNLLGAVVTPVAGARHIPPARGEALRVLELLRNRPALGAVAAAANVSDLLALAALRGAVRENSRLVAQKARAVLAHDALHDTGYAALLLGYFECLFDTRRTAGRLHVHPNTVRYRLRRISTGFGLDLNDPDQVLALWVGLQAQEIR